MSIAGFLVVAIIGCGYFLPTIIAYRHHHNRRDQIAVLNALLGWNPIFWATAFTWACTDDVEPQPVYQEPREPILAQPISRGWLITIGISALAIFLLFG
jgi:hypothetical protein